jgi:hypothetical protein
MKREQHEPDPDALVRELEQELEDTLKFAEESARLYQERIAQLEHDVFLVTEELQATQASLDKMTIRAIKLDDGVHNALIALKAQQDCMHGQDYNAMQEAIDELEKIFRS